MVKLSSFIILYWHCITLTLQSQFNQGSVETNGRSRLQLLWEEAFGKAFKTDSDLLLGTLTQNGEGGFK